MDFSKDGLMKEETNMTLYQRTQNVLSKKSIYTLKLLPKRMKEITKCHALQVYLVVENLGAGWCLSGAVWCPSLQCGVLIPVCSGGLVVSLYYTHEAKTLGRNWYISFTVGLTTREAIDTHEVETLGRNLYIWSRDLGTQIISFLDRRKQIQRPLKHRRINT